MRNVHIAYDPLTEKHLDSGNLTKALRMAVGFPYSLQNMCVGLGRNWDEACPKQWRGTLNKEQIVSIFTRAKKMRATVSIGLMGTASVTVRFFSSEKTEESFHEITVIVNNRGKSIAGHPTLKQFQKFVFDL